MKREIQGRMQAGADAEGWTARCRDATAMTVDEHPLGTTIGMFAIGLSLGVAIGAALTQPAHSRSRQVAESLGRRLLDAMQQMPGSVSQYLQR